MVRVHCVGKAARHPAIPSRKLPAMAVSCKMEEDVSGVSSRKTHGEHVPRTRLPWIEEERVARGGGSQLDLSHLERT